MRRIVIAAACAAALWAPAAAAATEAADKWRFECADTPAGRHCDLTADADIKVRGAPKGKPLVTVSWEVTNTAHGIVESLKATLDPEFLGAYEPVMVTDAEGTPLASFGLNHEASGPKLIGALMAAETVHVALDHVASFKKAAAKLSGQGFAAGRRAYLEEIRNRGANFW